MKQIQMKITIEGINTRLNDANITDWDVSIPECNHLVSIKSGFFLPNNVFFKDKNALTNL